MTNPKKARLLITVFVALLLIGGTVLAIQWAKGYRPNLKQLALKGNGLLSATSYPKNAQVFVDDHLTTVTDDTLYLTPADYQIKIVKTGFYPWEKTIPIKSELVSITDARLFPTIPSITPLTFYRIQKPSVSPDGNKLAYLLTNSPFPQDNGLYVLSLGSNLLLGNQIVQIADLNTHDYTKAELIWSPDSGQVLAVFHDDRQVTAAHLLNSRSLNQVKNLTDISSRLNQLLTTWQTQLGSVNQNNLNRLPLPLVQIATQSAVNVYFSPDREKVLYTTTLDLTLPENLLPKTIPSVNPTLQSRRLSAGKTYVYDLKEDSNYLIGEAVYNPLTAQPFVTNLYPTSVPNPTPKKIKSSLSPEIERLNKQINLLRGQTDPRTTQNLSWFSTNRHLIITSPAGAAAIEYDGNNLTPLINAALAEGFAVSSPDGSHLVILSNLNQSPDVFNLISLDLK